MWVEKTAVWPIRCWCNETVLLRDLLVPLLQCYRAQGCSEMSKYQRFATLELYNVTRTSVKCDSSPAPADVSSTCVSGASTLSHIHAKHRIMD